MARKFGYCSRFQGYLCKKVPSGYEVYHGRCKQWSCPECSQLLRARWRSHLALRIQELGGKWMFVTITAPSYKKQPYSIQLELSANLFKKRMNAIMQWFRDNYGRCNYVRVFEIQKRGAIHAHILMNMWFPLPSLTSFQKSKRRGRWQHKLLKEILIKNKFGHHVDVELLTGSPLQCAVYITKYITKESRQFESWLPKGMRYIQCSHGIGALNDKVTSADEWTVLDGRAIGALIRENTMFFDADNKMKEISWFDLDENYEWSG